MRRYLTTPPARFARSPTLPLLVWITISGTFPMHLLVPVLPQAARDLHVNVATIQLAITFYLIGLSAGQLLLGPLSDRYGRRPILITGLLIYVVGTISAAISPTMHALLAARTVQGIGGCAGLVLGRAIARDVAGQTDAVRKIALLSSVTSLGPGIAPLVGTYLAILLGWRGMLGALAISSLLLFAVTILTLPETHVNRRPSPVHAYIRSWGDLLRTPAFLRFCIGGAFGTTSFYAFVANAPFIFHDRFGFRVGVVAFLYLLVVGSITAGGLIASRLAGRVSSHKMVVLTGTIMTLSSAATLAMEFTNSVSAWPYLASIMILSMAIGLCSPFAMSEAVNVDPRSIGAASGLYGCLQMAAGAVIVVFVGALPGSAITNTGIGLLCASLIALFAFAVPITASSPDRGMLTDEESDAAL